MEAGKGEGKEEIFSGISVTSDTMAPGAGRGEGGEIPDEGGRERESATTFAAPGVWRISDVNSEMYASWRCWWADQGGETLERAETRGR